MERKRALVMRMYFLQNIQCVDIPIRHSITLLFKSMYFHIIFFFFFFCKTIQHCNYKGYDNDKYNKRTQTDKSNKHNFTRSGHSWLFMQHFFLNRSKLLMSIFGNLIINVNRSFKFFRMYTHLNSHSCISEGKILRCSFSCNLVYFSWTTSVGWCVEVFKNM